MNQPMERGGGTEAAPECEDRVKVSFECQSHRARTPQALDVERFMKLTVALFCTLSSSETPDPSSFAMNVLALAPAHPLIPVQPNDPAEPVSTARRDRPVRTGPRPRDAPAIKLNRRRIFNERANASHEREAPQCKYATSCDELSPQPDLCDALAFGREASQ
jgi:hypothetical protein